MYNRLFLYTCIDCVIWNLTMFVCAWRKGIFFYLLDRFYDETTEFARSTNQTSSFCTCGDIRSSDVNPTVPVCVRMLYGECGKIFSKYITLWHYVKRQIATICLWRSCVWVLLRIPPVSPRFWIQAVGLWCKPKG